jgi:PAS domain S-box-containing protein
VFTADSGLKGLDLARSEQPDAILLDIKMPEMDGFEVCERLKADARTGPIPVIMLTALKTESRDLVRGLESGADAYLSKPVDENVLAAQVKTALRIRKAELALRQQNEELDALVREKTASLKQSEERVKALLNATSEAAVLIDTAFCIQAINIEAARRLGCSPEECLNACILDFLTPEIARQRQAQATQVIHTGRPLSFEDEREGLIFSHRVYPVLNHEQHVVQLALFTRDITEERQHEAQRAQLENQLRQAQKMEAVGTLAGGIAHDFNNILSAILGYTDLALTEVQKGTLLHQNLSEVLFAGNRARELVGQILSISRPDTQEMRPVPLNSLVKEAMKMLRSTIPSSISLRERVCQEQLMVVADPTQLHQVIVNLATNAKQAMPEQNGEVEVWLDRIVFDDQLGAAHPDLIPGPYARLSVSDTGIGIPKEQQEKIFEPYFTTKERGEGTGLGLSVVHGIVRAHKGKIVLSSQPGRGSLFQVYLPLDEREPGPEIRSESPGELPGGTETILVVDDEEAIVNMVRQFLERLGYSVTPCYSSPEALKAFQAAPDAFDLMITDMTMPGLTGLQLAGELFKIRSDLPVILCTGYSDSVSEDSIWEHGLAKYLKKPIKQEELAFSVRQALDSALPCTS